MSARFQKQEPDEGVICPECGAECDVQDYIQGESTHVIEVTCARVVTCGYRYKTVDGREVRP